MEELFNSYRQFVKERMSTPFFANFIFSWFIWNWEKVYSTIFLSEDIIRPNSKLQFVKTLNYDNEHLFLYPLYTTLIVTAAFPLINLLVYGYRELAKKLKKLLGLTINKNTPISNQEYWELNKRLERTEQKYTESINSYTNKVTELNSLKAQKDELEIKTTAQYESIREELNGALKKHTKLETEISNTNSKLEDSEKRIDILREQLDNVPTGNTIDELNGNSYLITFSDPNYNEYDHTDAIVRPNSQISFSINDMYIDHLHFTIDMVENTDERLKFRATGEELYNDEIKNDVVIFDLKKEGYNTNEFSAVIYDFRVRKPLHCTLSSPFKDLDHF
jgi:uncharacterized protein YeeX (DUF496 family)